MNHIFSCHSSICKFCSYLTLEICGENESAVVSLLFTSQENTLTGFYSIALGSRESLGPAGAYQTRAILCKINLCKACMSTTESDYWSSVHVLFCSIIVQLIASPKGLRKNVVHTWKTVSCQYVPGNIILTLICTMGEQEQFGIFAVLMWRFRNGLQIPETPWYGTLLRGDFTPLNQ